MACHLAGAMQLFEPMLEYCQLDLRSRKFPHYNMEFIHFDET